MPLRLLTTTACVFLLGVAFFGASRLPADFCMLKGRFAVAVLLQGKTPSPAGIERAFATRACARAGGRAAEAARDLGLVYLSLLERERASSASGKSTAWLAKMAFLEHLAVRPASAVGWLGLAYAHAALDETSEGLEALAAVDQLAPHLPEFAALRALASEALEKEQH